jgi:murein L,D-transpeptidase YafK
MIIKKMNNKVAILGIFFFILIGLHGTAQPIFSENTNGSSKSFLYSKAEDSVIRQFQQKKLNWPPSAIFFRAFKYDRVFEVWVRDDSVGKFKFFKAYNICMQSGTMGPKRMEGDYQVPEGFYHINDFNPKSNYHLSMGINYPNASDRVLSDSLNPGSNIYIHGNCVSVGCIAMGDYPIEELYFMASTAKAQGQDFIPVHIFPVKYDVKKSTEYLNNVIKNNTVLLRFNKTIKDAYDYFELKKELPLILVDRNGDYLVN